MRWIYIINIIAILVSIAICKKVGNFNIGKKEISTENKKDDGKVSIKKHSKDLALFARQNGYNTNYCLLFDLKIPSGKNRCFVYDIKGDSITIAGLVTHGSGKTYSTDIILSNEMESKCTSTGKYKISHAYNGKFGLAYKLYGLDSSNSNAYNRFVVLHAHPAVPIYEIYPQKICTSWGCPTVSPLFLKEIKTYLDKPGKPILLWIYN